MSQADRIIEAAHTCFSRFGFNKTSMEDIAREAFRLAGHKLPLATRFVLRREVL